MRTHAINRTLVALVYLLLTTAVVHSAARAGDVTDIAYRSVTVEDVDIFYREAGNPDRPTILLLHGFPTSSHMFRELIPELAGQYHLLDTRHFALETHHKEIADLMRDFPGRKVGTNPLASN